MHESAGDSTEQNMDLTKVSCYTVLTLILFNRED